MTLVAKNRITEYVNEHPEARITLLTWLKEYPYRQEQNMFLDQEGKSLQGFATGNVLPDLGVYSIKYRINFSAKAAFINWIGTRQEHEEESEREFKEMQQKNPSLTRSVKVATIVIKSPDFEGTEQLAESRQTKAGSDAALFLPALFEEVSQVDSGNDLSQEQIFKTEAAYKQGLVRLSGIFEAQLDTPEFDELLILLRLVKNYEEYELKFPQLKVFEVVAHKMEMFKMTPADLAKMLGIEDQFYQFLSGKQTLPSQILIRLYKYIGIRFPVNDQRFL